MRRQWVSVQCCVGEIQCEVYVRECTVQQERHRPTEVSTLYGRGVSVCCDRGDVCMQKAGGYMQTKVRKCTDNGSRCAVLESRVGAQCDVSVSTDGD